MKKRILFMDRDGTLIAEPPVDYQVDSLEKLEFLPGIFRNLYRLRQSTDYLFVLVSNQDCMGSPSFPEEKFRLPHKKFLQALENEGICFDAIHIDPSLPEENSPDRKPGTGMLKEYMTGEYDLENSYVIGDRYTDIQLAANLGARGILYGNEQAAGELSNMGLSDHVVLVSQDWDEIGTFLRSSLRQVMHNRVTGETQITVKLSLDGEGRTRISTGLGFFDHMLDQLGRHGGLDLEINARGDLDVDEHHTIEDTAITLGEAVHMALGDKKGIERYAFVLPMDDSEAAVSLDFGGRAWLEWSVELKREKVGDFPTEMLFHFFKSFSDAARCNLNIKAEGSNEHHKIEAIFKAFARVLKQAVKLDPDNYDLPSTKGKL